MTSDAIFDLIARNRSDYSVRAGQKELSDLILQAVEIQVDVIAEAPTGFGKSFSALIPAIIEAQRGHRTVIATETLNLQDQYIGLDLPFLHKICCDAGIHFSYAVAKGRSNFVCRLKLDEDNFAGSTQMMQWAKAQELGRDTGDMTSVPFQFQMSDWYGVSAEDDCERAACPFYGKGRNGESECFVYDAIRKFQSAQIVIANHTLVLIDAQLGIGSLLGAYDTLIVDEAHGFAEKAQDTWGVTIKPRTVSNTLKLINKILERQGVDYFESGYLTLYRSLEDAVFSPFVSILGESKALRQIPQDIVESSKEAAKRLAAHISRANKDLNALIVWDEQNPKTIAIRTAKERLSKLTADLGAVYGEGIDENYRDNWLVFFETGYTAKHEKYGILKLRPINVAPLMRGRIFDMLSTSVFMSATMRIGSSFGFMKRELGMPSDTLEFIGESPFNFEQNVVGYFPNHLPDNKDKEYISSLAEEIQKVLEHTNGKALVLFTNNSHMKFCYEAIFRRLKYKCYMQGQGAKATLIELFKHDVHSCLFATRSFFTGVDLPGETLSCVVLTKAPFQVPNDPMFAAKADKIDSEGGDSFNALSMPLMLFDVRQSFGRLIRTTDDTGLFAFLDSRAMRKSYGQRIINALPTIKILSSLDGTAQVRPVKRYTYNSGSSKKTARLEED
jgi:ATP-dependent DNA helicase DinG